MGCNLSKVINYYFKASLIIIGVAAIFVGLIFLAQFYYNPAYNIEHLWPVFPIIGGVGAIITAAFARCKKSND